MGRVQVHGGRTGQRQGNAVNKLDPERVGFRCALEREHGGRRVTRMWQVTEYSALCYTREGTRRREKERVGTRDRDANRSGELRSDRGRVCLFDCFALLAL